MRRALIVAQIVVLFLLLTSLIVQAQAPHFVPSPYIYRLDVRQCEFEPRERTLTGFRVKDKVGIVTALHGVVGCDSVVAQPAPGGAGPFKRLKIVSVDVDRDVALLWSAELGELPAEGLAEAADSLAQDYENLEVIGYPYGVFRQRPTTRIEVLERIQLGYIVPPDILLALTERDSPAVDIEVLSIQTHLVPGHSGSPIVNGSGKVIAIADGGLNSGTVEMSWALPWQDIEWKTVSYSVSQQISWKDYRRLAELRNLDPSLFSMAAPISDDVGLSDSDQKAAETLTPTATWARTPTSVPAPPTPRPIEVSQAGAVRNITLLAPVTSN